MRIFHRNNLFLILLINLNFYVFSQDSDLLFEHINHEEGFSQGMVGSIKQSRKGFIWIGTANGLYRYDGYKFHRYVRDKDKKGSLGNNHINVIFEDSDNNLLIGTSNGVNLFRKNTDDFLEVDVLPIKGGRNYITSFIEDDQKNVWVGTFGGVKRLNKQNYLLENISSDSNYILNQSRVLSLFYDDAYGVLVGTSQGLKCFNPNNGEQKELPEIFYKTPAFLKAKIWKTIKEVNGDLWFATETMGAFHYSKAQNKLIQYVHDFNDENSISSNWVNDIISINDNTIWFATKDGLSVFNRDRKEFTQYKHNPLNESSLSDNDVKCFLKDRHGSIWLGTIVGGVNFYNKANSNFRNIGETVKPNFGLNNSIVKSILREEDNILWIGTYGGGLNYLDFNNRKSEAYLADIHDERKTNNLITSLAHKDKDNLLCGTFTGLFNFNKTSKKFTFIPLSTNSIETDERPVMSLLEDNGDVWVATNGNGLKKILKDGTIENYLSDRSPNSLSDNFVIDLENRENGLWVTTQDGLNYFDKSLKKFTKVYRTEGPNSIGNNSLTVLFTDSNDRLWIGGDYDGLNYFNESTESFLTINKGLGLTDATIESISEDSEGNLWVSAEDLLFKITINNHTANLKLSDFQITSYSSKDGVSVKQFFYNSSAVLNKNELVFGATKGLTIFSPQNIFKSPNDTEMVITNLVVNNKEVFPGQENTILQKPISETTEISLNYNQGYIGLEFSSLNFVNPKNSKYAFKLDNKFRKDDWHEIGTQNRINLTDLASGSYMLSIKSSNEDGIWNPNIKTLGITILPPWWETWWAYLFYLCLAFVIIFITIRFVNNRIKLKRELFLEHVENERHQELYNMQLNFFTNISHEIRTPLTLISGPVEELLSSENNTKIEGKLKTIKHNSDRLLKLVNELLDFRKAEKGLMKIYCEKQDIVAFCFEIFESFKGLSVEKQIEYKFVLNTNSIQVYFDKNQMEKVIYNLLSNAFKFTKKNGKIIFSVEQSSKQEGMVYIKIKDNGIGIPEHSKKHIFNRFFQVDDRGVQNMGSGVGLALSKSIVELHHGDITIPEDKESWANTVFQISLLLGKKHLTSNQIVNGGSEDVSNLVIDLDNEYPRPSQINESLLNGDQELDANKKTVLLVEDNDEVRKFVSSIIFDEYNVLEFANGKDALAYMEKEIPDLIISDIMMPEMDGLELCKFVKSNESTNHIPVILLTAKSSIDNRIEGLTTGADAYISKPFSTKVLKLNIANLLKSKEILRSKYSGNFIIDSDLEKLSTPEEIFIKKLMKIIESNIENPDFDVNELVKEIGMSRTILYKKVSALTNHSVASLIKQIRLKKAADIILNTTYPISEVAFMVGFNDRKHFSKEFKKVYNFSPTIYKNSQLAKQ